MIGLGDIWVALAKFSKIISIATEQEVNCTDQISKVTSLKLTTVKNSAEL
jgi:hypothetical protein